MNEQRTRLDEIETDIRKLVSATQPRARRGYKIELIVEDARRMADTLEALVRVARACEALQVALESDYAGVNDASDRIFECLAPLLELQPVPTPTTDTGEGGE